MSTPEGAMSHQDSRVEVRVITGTSAPPVKTGEARLYVMYDPANPRRASSPSPKPNGTLSSLASRTGNPTWTMPATCREVRVGGGLFLVPQMSVR